MQELKFDNPHEEVLKRDFYLRGPARLNFMMSILHNDVLNTPRIYYCGMHHYTETVSTYEVHKKKPNLQNIYKGQILGKFQEGKIRILFFAKYCSQADKIQKKKNVLKATTERKTL